MLKMSLTIIKTMDTDLAPHHNYGLFVHFDTVFEFES